MISPEQPDHPAAAHDDLGAQFHCVMYSGLHVTAGDGTLKFSKGWAAMLSSLHYNLRVNDMKGQPDDCYRD